MADNKYKGYDWDDEVSVESKGRTTLPEGEYGFEISGINKTSWKSGKLEGLKKMELLLTVWDENGNEVDVEDSLTLCHEFTWKTVNLMKSCGIIAKDADESKIRIPWDKLKGRPRGVAKVVVESFTGRDGQLKKTNKIGGYVIGKPVPPRKSDTNGGEEDLTF